MQRRTTRGRNELNQEASVLYFSINRRRLFCKSTTKIENPHQKEKSVLNWNQISMEVRVMVNTS